MASSSSTPPSSKDGDDGDDAVELVSSRSSPYVRVESSQATVSASPKDQGAGAPANLVQCDLPCGIVDEAVGDECKTASLAWGDRPEPEDIAAAVMPYWARLLIFILICQTVQAFMSYDGGATPASLDSIQAEMGGEWTPWEFGVLGAMDKIGMTSTSLLWGGLLQVCPAKQLLSAGLALNALCTGLFALLRTKSTMYTAKFFMGSTQSLQGVWSTVWTVMMAPPRSKAMWLGLGGVSAGIGNGIGTAVAGFSTANGMSYSFAFFVQAGILVGLLFVLLALPSKWLKTTLPPDLGRVDPSASPTIPVSAGFCRQFRDCWRNKIYYWTALTIAVAMFVMSGIQFLWVRLFMEVWSMDKNTVTVAFLVVTGLGGGLGIGVGGAYIDRRGGFHTPPAMVTSLRFLRKMGVLASSAALWGMSCMYGKLSSIDQSRSGDWGDVWLWMMWVAIFFIWIALNAAIPTLCGVNMEVIPPEQRPFASGFEMTVRNTLGYVCGPLLPGLFMSLIEVLAGLNVENPVESHWQLCSGFAFVLFGNFVGFVCLNLAFVKSKRSLAKQQLVAIQHLRSALISEGIAPLVSAVALAKSLDVHTLMDGEAALGMANQAIGAIKIAEHEAHMRKWASERPSIDVTHVLRPTVLEGEELVGILGEEGAK